MVKLLIGVVCLLACGNPLMAVAGKWTPEQLLQHEAHEAHQRGPVNSELFRALTFQAPRPHEAKP